MAVIVVVRVVVMVAAAAVVVATHTVTVLGAPTDGCLPIKLGGKHIDYSWRQYSHGYSQGTWDVAHSRSHINVNIVNMKICFALVLVRNTFIISLHNVGRRT